MKKKGFGHAVMALLAVAGFGAAIMLLWNALLPNIFGIASINFWQALGLFALSRLLFGGLGAGAMKHAHRHHHASIREKWMNMSPEQRRKIIDKRRHFGFGEHFEKEHFNGDEHQEAEKGND